jgi:predicted metal-dependent phosphotriesterase family hydrolase
MLIVASGGLHGKSDYPPGTAAKTADQIADDFYRLAIAERWGAIGEMGTGTDVPMDAEERKALNAAAKLHRRTGLPIVTHVSDGCARCALEQVDLFEAAGVSLDRLRKNGGPGIDMTITNFVPRLRRAGVSDATLRTVLVENPRRVLSFVPPT